MLLSCTRCYYGYYDYYYYYDSICVWVSYIGLPIFRAVAEPRNSTKFTKTRKIPQNSVEILSNTCLYSNFETWLSYWGYLLAINSQIYVKTSSLKRANNVPKLPGVDYVAKKLGTSHDVKGFAIGSFLERIVQPLFNRKTLKTLVWSVWNRSIPSEICPKITTKSADFSTILALKIPRNLTFFPRPVRSPAYSNNHQVHWKWPWGSKEEPQKKIN